MAKMCLVSYQGLIEQIVEPGEEFEIYEGEDAKIKWISCSNDSITLDWIMKAGVFVERVQHIDYSLQRQVAYGPIGDQLDMIYKDQVNGTTTFKDHVEAVKAAKPAPSTEPENTEIQLTGTEENPAWES